MTWLLLTGAGLVVETTVIIALGRAVTARFDLDSSDPYDSRARDGARALASAAPDDRVAEVVQLRVVEGRGDPVRDTSALARGPREQLGTGWT